MDTTDERGLLAALQADPADDTSWLVLADWLEDQGRLAQAELTRLALQLRQPESLAAGDDRSRREDRLRELVAGGAVLPLPRRSFDLGKGASLEMRLIPPGCFPMGSPGTEPRRDVDEGPDHAVRLTHGFWLGTFPVTQEQWRAVLPSPPPGRFHGQSLPVDGVSWNDSQEFLAALRRRLDDDLPFRLPTEAEWEYACRAGTTTAFHFGGSLSSEQANFDGNYPYGRANRGPWLERTTPVGSYAANAFGLYDMHGNVWEWCSDWFAEGYYSRSPASDPTGPESGSGRVLRGGSWYSHSWSCRSAGRERTSPENGAGNYGFRVALTAASLRST